MRLLLASRQLWHQDERIAVLGAIETEIPMIKSQDVMGQEIITRAQEPVGCDSI